jgi:hypothetical protein
VRALQERHDALTVEHLSAGFQYQGRRIPFFKPQRGIFKPRRMRYLLCVQDEADPYQTKPRAGRSWQLMGQPLPAEPDKWLHWQQDPSVRITSAENLPRLRMLLIMDLPVRSSHTVVRVVAACARRPAAVHA